MGIAPATQAVKGFETDVVILMTNAHCSVSDSYTCNELPWWFSYNNNNCYFTLPRKSCLFCDKKA